MKNQQSQSTAFTQEVVLRNIVFPVFTFFPSKSSPHSLNRLSETGCISIELHSLFFLAKRPTALNRPLNWSPACPTGMPLRCAGGQRPLGATAAPWSARPPAAACPLGLRPVCHKHPDAPIALPSSLALQAAPRGLPRGTLELARPEFPFVDFSFVPAAISHLTPTVCRPTLTPSKWGEGTRWFRPRPQALIFVNFKWTGVLRFSLWFVIEFPISSIQSFF